MTRPETCPSIPTSSSSARRCSCCSRAAAGSPLTPNSSAKAAGFPRVVDPVRRILLLVLCLLALTGCGGVITPPSHLRDPVAVYVTDYGRHSSVLLPTDTGGLVDYQVGDWNWIAAGHRHWYNALGAIFFSEGTALGRRYFAE